MIESIRDPDVIALANLSSMLKSEYSAEELQWLGSPFAWIKARPSRQVGTVGERLVAGWLASKGFDVARSPDSDADRLVNGHRVEIKFSTLWKSGIYKFQQLRNQDYEFAICLGVSPFDAHCWVLPKKEIMTRWNASVIQGREVEGIQPQHGGSDGRDTAWLSVFPETPPPWLAAHGGRLAQAASYLARNLKRPRAGS